MFLLKDTLIQIFQALKYILLSFFLRFYLFIFREGGGRERISISCLLYVPHLGTKPTTQACTLIKNQTSNLSVASSGQG